MKLFINLPITDKGKKQFDEAMAKVQTILLIKTIDNLKLSNNSKRKVLFKVIEELKKEISS